MQGLKLRSNEYTGRLVVFEGTDGAGKTTLLTMAATSLRKRVGESGIICLKQPTDLSRKTKLFQKMMYSDNHEDIDYRAVQLLTMSDRLQQQYDTIVPALKNGKIVLCDRYIYTSLANMLARGYRAENWFYEAASYLLKPDAAFLCYIEAARAIERIKARPTECDRYLDENLLRNVAVEFLFMSDREGLTVIRTDRPAEETFGRIQQELEQKGIYDRA